MMHEINGIVPTHHIFGVALLPVLTPPISKKKQQPFFPPCNAVASQFPITLRHSAQAPLSTQLPGKERAIKDEDRFPNAARHVADMSEHHVP